MSDGSKGEAFLKDAKAVAGIDAFGNIHVLNTDVTGTLEVNATLANEPTIDIGKVDQGTGGTSPWLVKFDPNIENCRVITAVDFLVSSDTFTTTGNGLSHTNEIPHRSFALQVTGTGAPATAWNVVIEGSIDGIHFTPMLTHTQSLGDSIILWSSANQYASITYRTRVVSLTLSPATNIVTTVLATT